MRRAVTPLLAVTVALVLADSAIVTLALPEILVHLDATVGEVAWVLISYNIVLGVAAAPAARLLGARAHVGSAAGVAVFALASAACAVAPSTEVLVVARCVQALGGAAAVVGSLVLLVRREGERRGLATWITAGVVGTAVGPVVGGLLTDAIAWQAIFAVQVPFAVLAVPAALMVRGTTEASRPTIRAERPDQHRPAVRANVTQALLSAALTAALFLLVLLLVEGWQRSPATAALTVSVVPVSALAAAPVARWFGASPRVEVAVGCFLVAGGLTGLALPPSSHLAWTLAPQALVGLGLGLTVDRLTSHAMAARLPQARHAAWTIAARHLGVVVGLAVLTPVFTADLRDVQAPAQEAVTAAVLDASIPARDKIAVAEALGGVLTEQRGEVPDVGAAFDTLDVGSDPAALDGLERDLTDQVERAVTLAFRDSFLIGAGLALLALLTSLAPSRRGRPAPAPGSVPTDLRRSRAGS